MRQHRSSPHTGNDTYSRMLLQLQSALEQGRGRENADIVRGDAFYCKMLDACALGVLGSLGNVSKSLALRIISRR